LRGNTEGFIAAGSKLKWLELHGLEHFALYYTEYGRELQRRFFDHFLRGEDNGWERRPRVQLNIRHVDGSFTLRREANWPIPRTSWQRLYLNPASRGLSRVRTQEQSALSYEGLSGGVTFHSDALDEQMEITGPLAAKLWISSTTCDADLFLVLRIVAPDGSEVTFQGTDDAHQPPALGWLRASHRKLAVGSTDYRPLHAHDAREPLEPGNIYQVEIELWPTSVVVPAGYRIGLSIQGRDFRYVGDGPEAATWAERSAYCIQTGVGPYTHDDPIDRPADVFGGTVRVFGGGCLESSLLLPIIPEE
jgi:predicted acyl esterase